MASTTKSSGSERWAENWLLLRRLFSEWEPTDEMIREVWFRTFDRPHGLNGPGVINHDCLKQAIIEHRKGNPYQRPDFLKVSDLYRLERQRVLSELERARMSGHSRDDERRIVKSEHEARVETILKWPLERIEAARAEVARVFPGMRDKSGDPESWSQTYSGLIVSADQRLKEEGDTE